MPAFFRSLLGHRYWVLAYASFAIGLALPFDLRGLAQWIPVWLSGLMFFTGLRVTLNALASEVRSTRRVLRIGGMTVFKLIVLPVLSFSVAHLVDSPWALGLLLVTAMPAGLSSPAFTDVNRGNVALALWVVLSTSALCTLTIPLLLDVAGRFGPTVAPLESDELMRRAAFIAALLFGPFTVAQAVRRLFPTTVERHGHRFSPVALCFLLAVNFSATASTRELWLSTSLAELGGALGWVTGAATVALASGFLSTRVWARRDAVAFGSGAVYINNGLCIAFALSFYRTDRHVLLPAILVVVPMLWLVTRVGRGWTERARVDA